MKRAAWVSFLLLTMGLLTFSLLVPESTLAQSCCGLPTRAAEALKDMFSTGTFVAPSVTPGTTTVTGCQNRVIFGDNSSVLNCEAALGYTASTDTLTPTIITLPVGSAAATSINFGTAGSGLFSNGGGVAISATGGEYFRVQANNVQVFGNSLNLGATTQVLHQALGLTASTMTAEIAAQQRTATHAYTWSNAQVVALGATTTGNINVATLPAKTQVLDAMVVITGAGAGTTTLTVSCGDAIAGTPFINYVVASNAQAAANTVYGDAVAERGTSLDTEFWYLPSYTATTLVTCQFISSGGNLSAVTGSTGRVILTTRLLP